MPTLIPTLTPIQVPTEEQRSALNRWSITRHNTEDHGIPLDDFRRLMGEYRQQLGIPEQRSEVLVRFAERAAVLAQHPVARVVLSGDAASEDIIVLDDSGVWEWQSQKLMHKPTGKAYDPLKPDKKLGVPSCVFTSQQLNVLLKRVAGSTAERASADDSDPHVNLWEQDLIVSWQAGKNEGWITSVMSTTDGQSFEARGHTKVWTPGEAMRIANELSAYLNTVL